MKILIFGASGATGHHLVRQALSQGHIVTAYLRESSRLYVDDLRVKIIRGNITDLHQVLDAMKGQEAVLSALGASSPFKYDQSVVNGFKVIIRAMEIVGIQRLVYLSTMGVKDSRHKAGVVVKYIVPLLLSTEARGHETREQMVKETGLAWTIVRPPTLTNGKRKGRYRSGKDIRSQAFAASISRADVADFMLMQLNTGEYIHSEVAVMY